MILDNSYTWGPKEINGIDNKFSGHWSSNVNMISVSGISRTHAENDVIVTLNESFRPAHDLYIPGMIGTEPCLFRFYRSDGQIKLYYAKNYNVTGRARFSFMYLYQPM